MAAGDIKLAYRASSDLTITNLVSLASSATWVAGWTSGTIDNTTNLDLGMVVSAKITAGAAPTAGELRVSLYTMLDDSNWSDILSSGTEGTEGAATIVDTEIRDCALYPLWSTITDASASRVYVMPQVDIERAIGFMPHKCAIFIAHSMVQALAASGQQVTVKGRYTTVAQ